MASAYVDGQYIATLTCTSGSVTVGLPLFVKGNVAEVVNFTVDSASTTTKI